MSAWMDESGADASPTVLEPGTTPPATILGIAPPPVPPSNPGLPHGPRDLAGTELLERYEVEEVIGAGGMATVYRARHKTIQKPVAIKVLDDGLEWRLDAAERFLQEAQITSRVVHENVVEVTDFGTTADRVVFCVMELLQGQPLSDVIAETGPMPVPRAAEIMRQICSALEAAHAHGIIHRDLKPANVFCTPRPSNPDFVKLLDFGIARVTHDGDASTDPEAARPMPTMVGFIIGTPDYMAPEQACEEPLDHRVDVYAAGALFFELLTGRKPYLGKSTAELLAAHLHRPVPDPGHLVPSLSPAVRAIVTKAMAKERDDRFASMAEMSAAIADAVTADDIALLRTPGRRRMAAAGLAIGVLGLGGWLVSDPPVEARTAAPIEEVPVVVAPREAAPASVSGTAVPVVADEAIATIEPPLEPVAVEEAAPKIDAPRSTPRIVAVPKRARRAERDEEEVELPPVEPDVVAQPDDEPPPIADAEPMRARITEVKDPFADDDGPAPESPSGAIEEPAPGPTTVPEVGVSE